MKPTAAFTLIEVMVAVGILGGGLVAVMAMFAPLARLDAAGREQVAAVEAAGAVNARLRQMAFAEAVAAMGATFLVSRDTGRIGVAADPVWHGREEQKFFSVEVRRAEALGGPGEPASLAWLAFSLRVRWPVNAATGQREIVVPGSVAR
jgi:prepilin-type N-terminal cleavage/methylation domain-containing protein